jgi:DNA-binding NtrC family response regulator
MSKVKVLIIDDEEDFCENVGSFFKNIGLEVITSGSLSDGLRLLDEESPDVLFLDNNLPDGEGWQHTSYLLKNYPSLKINLISAYKESSQEIESLLNVKVWEKPLSLRKLADFFNGLIPPA